MQAAVFIFCLVLAWVLFSRVMLYRRMRITRDPKRKAEISASDPLVVCAIHAFESEYIGEWLDHHLGMEGVDYVLLYDNNDQGSDQKRLTQQIINSHPQRSRIRNIPWPGRRYTSFWGMHYPHASSLCRKYPFLRSAFGSAVFYALKCLMAGSSAQERAYKNAIETNPRAWLAFIDIDEFLNPQPGYSLRALLQDAEKKRSPYVLLKRPDFGSNGLRFRPLQGGVRRAYTRRQSLERVRSEAYKSVVHSDFVSSCYHHHWFAMKREYHRPWYAQDKEIILNHYCCKSMEEWKERRSRSSVSSSRVKLKMWNVYNQNEIRDTSILRHISS